MEGSATRTCTDNGTWTGAETQCNGKVTETNTLFKFIENGRLMNQNIE